MTKNLLKDFGYEIVKENETTFTLEKKVNHSIVDYVTTLTFCKITKGLIIEDNNINNMTGKIYNKKCLNVFFKEKELEAINNQMKLLEKEMV